MDCREVAQLVQLSLDDELESTDQVGFQRHIEECASCRAELERDAKIHHGLRQCVGNCAESAPPFLRQKIVATTRAHRRDVFEHGRWIAAGLAALILVGLSAGGTSESSVLIDETVARHSANHPPEVRAGRSAEPQARQAKVRKFFSDNLRYPVSVPNLEGHHLPVKLVGARLSSVKDRDAAFVMYDHRGARLSLFAVPSPSEMDDPEGFQRVQTGRRDLLVGRRRGYNVVSWREGGLMYSLVSDVDSGELVRLATYAR